MLLCPNLLGLKMNGLAPCQVGFEGLLLPLLFGKRVIRGVAPSFVQGVQKARLLLHLLSSEKKRIVYS